MDMRVNQIDRKKPFAGMIDNGADFFLENGRLYVSHNRVVYEWPDFPQHIMDIVEADMLKYPEAIRSLGAWENLLPENYLFQYISCRFGGLDDEADINVKGEVHLSEYVPCQLRGQCRFEGKLCQSLKVKNGVITKRELDVLRLIDEDNKIIADRLFISIETVNTHIINLREKVGVANKALLSIWAAKKGII